MGIQDQRPSVESKSCQDKNSSTIKSYQSLTVFHTNADNLIHKRNELYPGNHMYNRNPSQKRVTTC